MVILLKGWIPRASISVCADTFIAYVRECWSAITPIMPSRRRFDEMDFVTFGSNLHTHTSSRAHSRTWQIYHSNYLVRMSYTVLICDLESIYLPFCLPPLFSWAADTFSRCGYSYRSKWFENDFHWLPCIKLNPYCYWIFIDFNRIQFKTNRTESAAENWVSMIKFSYATLFMLDLNGMVERIGHVRSTHTYSR